MNSISLEKNKQTTSIQLRETKLISVKNRTVPYNCIRSEDIPDYLVYIKVAQIVKKEMSELTVNLLEEVEILWSANFHLKIFYLLRDIMDFLNSIKKMITKSSHFKDSTLEAFNFLVYGVFTFHVRISNEHSAKLLLGNIIITLYIYS